MHKSCDLTYGLLGDCGPAPPWLPRRVLGGTKGWRWGAAAQPPGNCQACALRWPRSPATEGHHFLPQAGWPAWACSCSWVCAGLCPARPFLLREGHLPPRLPPPFSGLPNSGQGRLWASPTCGGNACGRAAWPSFLSASCCLPLPPPGLGLTWFGDQNSPRGRKQARPGSPA